MGCRQSLTKKSGSDTYIPQNNRRWSGRSSASIIVDGSRYLSTNDKVKVRKVFHILSSQGTDADVGMFTFEKVFERMPAYMNVFAEAAKYENASMLDWKVDPHFRNHIREVISSIQWVTKYLDDEDVLKGKINDLRNIHVRIRGLETFHFEVFVRCFYEGVLTTLGNAITKAERDSLKKFLNYLYSEILPEALKERATRASSGERKSILRLYPGQPQGAGVSSQNISIVVTKNSSNGDSGTKS